MVPETEMILKLILAMALGGIIGLERERYKHPAGLRTHMLVCLGSALVIILAYGINGTPDTSARVAAGIITGIGFLGAGTIIREEEKVKGLTTAACLWAVAGMGIAVGYGFYLLSIVATLLIAITLELRFVESMFNEKTKKNTKKR